MDIYEQIQTDTNKLETTIGLARKYSLDYAEKERQYRMLLSQRLVQLRAEGQAVTSLNDIVRGEKEVSTLRYNRDVAEGMKDSAIETINYLKLKLRLLEAQLRKRVDTSKKDLERRYKYMLKIKDGAIVILNDDSRHIAKNNEIYEENTNICYNYFKGYDDTGKWCVKDKSYRRFDIANFKDLITSGLVVKTDE